MLNQTAGKRELARAGVTLFAGLCVLGLFIIAFGGHRFWERLDEYAIRFNGVKNLDVGRPVKYAGINVGRVLSIDVDKDDPALVRVVVGLHEGFTVYQGTKASISQKGLVGDNFVLLNLSGKAGPPLPVGSEIPPDATPDLMEVAASMAGLAADLQPKLSEIADSLRALLNTDNRRQVEEILKEVTVLVKDANSAIRSMDKEFRGLAREAGAGIAETRALVGEVRSGMQTTMGTVNTAVTDTRQDLALTLEVLRVQTAAVGGAVTELTRQVQHDLDYDQARLEEILENTAELTRNLNVLTRSLRERPWQIIYRPDDSKKEQ